MLKELVKMCGLPAIMIGGILYGAPSSDAAAAGTSAAVAAASPRALGGRDALATEATPLDEQGAALTLTTSCDDVVCDQLCGEAGACEGNCNPLGRCYCIWPYPSGECP